ncbi:MAG: 16S rRNA (cytosine(1402)-N(4))-methyltransferase RsmH [Patescibacteria group bacterium]
MHGMESVHKAVLLHEVVESLVRTVSPAVFPGRGTTCPSPKHPSKLGRETKELSIGVGGRWQVSPMDMLSPCQETLANNGWYLDGTLGGCGHALAIAEALKGQVNIIGLDWDKNAIERAKKIFKEVTEKKENAGKIILECENFRNLDKVLNKHGIQAVNIILLDLGLSSDELEKSGRGFSFQKDELLLMTMGEPVGYPFTAKDILNRWTEQDIANVIYGYGEERFARRIARAVCVYREKKKIETSGELCEIIRTSVPAFYKRGTTSSLVSSGLRSARKIHPATKTFQALRIAVNDELGALKEGLTKGYERLTSGGKMAVISFHSLEDAIVKNFFKEKAKTDGAMITKKPMTAGVQEIAENPRSRSAKLRVIQKSF